MDTLALAVLTGAAVVVGILIAIDRKLHPTCKREKAGYRCRRTYKQRCEGCQPVEAKR